MTDRKLDKINKQIADLEREREKLLSDPKREEVRELYGELDRILDRLAELGEDVVTRDGEIISIVGTRFSYMHGMDLHGK